MLSFSELFDDISLVLNIRRLCVVVDSLISAAKVCDYVISAWCTLTGMWLRGTFIREVSNWCHFSLEILKLTEPQRKGA